MNTLVTFATGLSGAGGFPSPVINKGFTAGAGVPPADAEVSEVVLRGCLGCANNILHNHLLFTLPSVYPNNYSPTRTLRVPVSKAGGSMKPASLQVNSAGEVRYMNEFDSGTTHIFLDGVRWYTR